MAHTYPKLIFGAAAVAQFSPDELETILDVLNEHNVHDLDTANIYPQSEITLGKAGAPKKFTIHTKAPGFTPGSLARESLLDGIDKSLEELGVKSVETYFLHSPDPSTPLDETLFTISEIHSAGKFKHFGLSNFLAADVQKIYDIQLANGAVLPTVYQGNYNAVARHIEDDLFPLLRKLKIAFYAYSPIAGGFLVKTSDALRSGNVEGRFAKNSPIGSIYTSLYLKESLYKALDEWQVIAKDAGISKVSLAYRWVAYHSALKPSLGDAIILGASKVAQLQESLKAIEDGPLDAKTAKRVDALWDQVKDEAPIDNYNSFAAATPLK